MISFLQLRFIALLAVLTGISNFLPAQKLGKARADSLSTELNKTSDAAKKLAIYPQLILAYNDFDREAAYKLEPIALKLAAEMDDELAEADIKSAAGRVYWREGNFQRALVYHNEARSIFEKQGRRDKSALVIRYIGQDYADAGNYPEALKNLQQALTLYTQLNDKINMGYAHELIAWVYRKQGNYDLASHHGYAMLTLFEDVGDANSIAGAASEVAEIYLHLGNYQTALKYFKRANEVFKKRHDRIREAMCYNLIGNAYRLLKKYPEALENYNLAITGGEVGNDMNVIANGYQGKGTVFRDQKQYASALDHFKKAAEIYKIWSNKRELANTYCQMASCYHLQGNYSLAQQYYNDAFPLCQELKSKALLAEYYQGREKLDSALGRWKEAYVDYKNYTAYRDSIFNQQNIEKMVQLKLSYEFDKREAAAKAEQAEKETRQQKMFLALGAIALLILLLAVVLYRSRQHISKINEELEQKSKSLEEENRQKTSILNFVSHDLKAPFSKIKGLTDLMRMTEPLTKEEKDEYLEHIQNSIDQGVYLISSLLEAQRLQSEWQAIIAEIDLHKFVHDFRLSTEAQLLKKQQHLQASINASLPVFRTDRQMLTRILDNLVSNASKFSERGKTIHLQVTAANHQIVFSVRDEGPGISAEDQQKMFRKFQRLTAQPTAGEGSTGLGLSITKALVENLKGYVEVNSIPGMGTTISVHLPMAIH